MKTLVLTILVFYIGLGSGLNSFDFAAIPMNFPDSVKIDIQVNYDSNALPEGYSARIITPVCEGTKCYAIEIDFSWDLLGRFLQFDTIPGKALTKLDHVPLSQTDYIKLKNLLRNPNSVLARYTSEELVKNTRNSTIDGFTGATIQEVKNAIVEGAVYSCFTLWHLAHGPVRDSLRAATKEYFSNALIQKLVDKNDTDINYFLIDNFTAEDFSLYHSEVLKMMGQTSGYFTKNALERIPEGIISAREYQVFFASNFNHWDYFTQVALLEKLDPLSVGSDLKTVIKGHMDGRNSYKNQLILTLLSVKQENK